MILASITYHPRVGKEAELLKKLKTIVAPSAYQNRASMVGIYHKKDADAIVVTSHHPNEETVKAYLKAGLDEEITALCSSPSTTDIFEILSEEAA